MSVPGPPPGWYPDPHVVGGGRYFDGTGWTEYRSPPPAFAPSPHGWWQPRWKGSQLGRPALGPGSLANPGRRLGARLLDGLVLVPVFVVVAVIGVTAAAPHVGPLFPQANPRSGAPVPFPGILWIYLVLAGCLVVTGLFQILYETVATVRFGRTLGKAWLHIRPLRTDGSTVGGGRALGRAALYWVSGALGWLGIVDPLWCLWDDNHQCLHDKAVDTIVINDATAAVHVPPSSTASPPPYGMGPSAPAASPAPYGTWPSAPAASPAPYGTGPHGSVSGYWYPPGYPPIRPSTNGLAVASLVCAILGLWLVAIPSVVGVVLGFVARAQIRRAQATQSGGGLALAGIIVGIAVVVLWFLALVVPYLVGSHR